MYSPDFDGDHNHESSVVGLLRYLSIKEVNSKLLFAHRQDVQMIVADRVDRKMGRCPNVWAASQDRGPKCEAQDGTLSQRVACKSGQRLDVLGVRWDSVPTCSEYGGTIFFYFFLIRIVFCILLIMFMQMYY